jgi:WD40 repeat protein
MRSEKQQRRLRHGKEPLRENKPFSNRVSRKMSGDVREPVNPVQMSPQTSSSSSSITQVPDGIPYVLAKLREKFEGKVDFSQTAFICVQHSMQTTAAMFQVLKDLGARHLFDMGKLYSSSEQGVEALKKLCDQCEHFRYFEHDPNIIRSGEFRKFSEIYEAAVDYMVKEFEAHLKSLPKETIKNVIVLDDGGTVIGRIARASDEQGRFCGYPVGAVEQTTAGFRDIIEQFVDQKEHQPEELKIPVVGVSASAAKSIFEPSFIADAVFESILSQFPQLRDHTGLSVGMVGYGMIGEAVVKRIQALDKGHTVFIYDQSEPKLDKLAEDKDIESEQICFDLEELLHKGTNIIFGASGNDMTRDMGVRLVEVFNDPCGIQGSSSHPIQLQRRTLVSCSSENKEFFEFISHCFKYADRIEKGRREVNGAFERTEEIFHRIGGGHEISIRIIERAHQDPIPDLEIELKNCVVSIPRSGYPINFSPHYSEKNQKVLCSVPSGKIQCIIGCLLGGMIQAYELSKVPQGEPVRSRRDNLFRLWPVFQNLAVKYWLEDNTPDQDRESREQFPLEVFDIFNDLGRIDRRSGYKHQKNQYTDVLYGCRAKIEMRQDPEPKDQKGLFGISARIIPDLVQRYSKAFFESISPFKCSSNRVVLIQKLKCHAEKNKQIPYIFSHEDPADGPIEYVPIDDFSFQLREKGSSIQISPQDLFTKSEQCICIEGTAGVGKTRLCQRLYYDWATGKLWQNQFDFVVLIEMRSLHASVYQAMERVTLVDIIYEEYYRRHNQQILAPKEELAFFIKNNQGKVLFILDGCDECDLINQKFRSAFIDELFSGQYSVLLTSRPECLQPDFKRYVHYRLENPGFESKDIVSYVNRFFKGYDNEEGVRLLEFIDTDPVVADFAQIPLHLELFCLIWGDHYCFSRFTSNQAITLTWLYDEVFKFIWKRYQIKCRRERSGLKRDIAKQVPYLQRIAFENLEQTRFAINLVSEDIEAFLKAGFIIRSSEEGDNLYEFIHRSFHEYYVARYLIDKIFPGFYSSVTQDHPFNQKSLVNQPGILEFLACFISGNQSYIDRLFEVVRASAHEEIQQAAANAITILNVAGVSFSGMVLPCRIPGADLRYAQCSGTDFTKAVLTRVNFTGALLFGTLFKEAQMKEVEFGEYASLKGHTGSVSSICFSPDSRMLASGSKDESVCLWIVDSGRLKKQFHSVGEVEKVCFSPRGDLLAFGNSAGSIFLLGVESEKQISQLSRVHKSGINSVEFSPDQKILATSSTDKTVRLWRIVENKLELQTVLKHNSSVNSLSFSSNGQYLASGCADGWLYLWDTSNFQRIDRPLWKHKYCIAKLCFSPNSEVLASCNSKAIYLWNVTTGELIMPPLQGHDNDLTSLNFSPDGQWLVSGSNDYTIRLWNLKIGKQLPQSVRLHPSFVKDVAFSPSGTMIASVSEVLLGPEDNVIHLWDVENLRHAKQHFKIKLGTYPACIGFSPDGKILACGSYREEREAGIHLWDVASGRLIGQPLRSENDGSVYSVAFSANQKILASSEYGGPDSVSLHLWDLRNSRRIEKFVMGGWRSINTLCFLPNGEVLISVSKDGCIHKWNIKTKEEEKFFLDPTRKEGNYKLALSPDGKCLASHHSCEKVVYLWNITVCCQEVGTFKLPRFVDCVNSLCFSRTGKYLASSVVNNNIVLWDAVNKKQIGVYEGHTYAASALSFSPDDRKLASGSDDRSIRLWDISTGQQIGKPLLGHANAISAIAFSPNGELLASAGADLSCIVWHISNRYILWKTNRRNLILQEANITNVLGLSPGALALLKQNHAIGEPQETSQQPIIQTARMVNSSEGITKGTVEIFELVGSRVLENYRTDEKKILYVLSGTVEVSTHHWCKEAKPQQVIFIPAHTSYALSKTSVDSVSFLSIFVTAQRTDKSPVQSTEMFFTDASRGISVENPRGGIYGYPEHVTLYEDYCEEANLFIIELPSSTFLPSRYCSAIERVCFILEGKARCVVNEQSFFLQAGHILPIPKMTSYEISNISHDQPLKFFLICFPAAEYNSGIRLEPSSKKNVPEGGCTAAEEGEAPQTQGFFHTPAQISSQTEELGQNGQLMQAEDRDPELQKAIQLSLKER